MADTAAAAVRENVAAERRYLESCSELSSAISTLESAVTAFVGKDRGDIKVSTRRWPANPDRPILQIVDVGDSCGWQVFAQTRARLESELAEGEFNSASPSGS
jgi:hypothetical protein